MQNRAQQLLEQTKEENEREDYNPNAAVYRHHRSGKDMLAAASGLSRTATRGSTLPSKGALTTAESVRDVQGTKIIGHSEGRGTKN